MTASHSDNYFSYTKNILISLLFVSPFLLVYELICFFYFHGKNYQIRNSADVIVREFFNYFGSYSQTFYALSLFAVILMIHFLNKDKYDNLQVNIYYLFFMFIEGLLFGILLVLLLNDFSIFSIKEVIYQSNLLLNLYLCIGAGIWEEILFRLILFSVIYNFLNIFKNINEWAKLIIPIIISSIFFSLFHYVGANGELFSLSSFIIRTAGGVYLCVLYYFRGFAISAMAHISYDFILVSLPLIYSV